MQSNNAHAIDWDNLTGLVARLAERRNDLKRLFGEARYQERVAIAKERVKEAMASLQTDNPLQAAIRYCRQLAIAHPGEDVTTAQQFILCAACDLTEGR